MRHDTATGIRNLCRLAAHILETQPLDNATTFAVREVLREAVFKSNPAYRGAAPRREQCEYVSTAALPHVDDPAVRLVADHTLPIARMLREVQAQAIRDVDTLVALAARHSTMTLITEPEDARLRSLGLGKDMPAGWDGVELFARYRVAGIEVVDNPRVVALVGEKLRRRRA